MKGLCGICYSSNVKGALNSMDLLVCKNCIQDNEWELVMFMQPNIYLNMATTIFGLKPTQGLKTKYNVRILDIMLLTDGIHMTACVLIPKVLFGLYQLRQTHGRKPVTL